MNNGIGGASVRDTTTRSLLKKIWTHLGKRRRMQVLLVLGMMVISGFAELFSLGAVIPLLAVFSSPRGFLDSRLGQMLYEVTGIDNENGMIVFTTLLFIGASIVTACIRLSNLWLNGKIAAKIGSDISREAYRRSINQPYGVQINRNTSTLIVAVTQHVAATVSALTALLQLITATVVAISIFVGLLLLDITLLK